ncbi:MAG TPA: type II toxin-antitoxin system PemK/MazF family toxin [Caldilineaceae bacterium]|nr:type II toxin-antitoxin system PemK/MazF family toxin [Caldilineaceae bacterium]
MIISPNEMNQNISTVIIAPLTSQGKVYPIRLPCQFQGKDGLVVLNQLRTVDKSRLVKRLGQLKVSEQQALLAILGEMIAP